ncbi:nucleotidyltransferase domain-containing protein [Chitinophaga nivalis]|uniref:Cyclic GMP-AMP synthase n=1 Tax=Chitinophaga nivalis TaxID=2991709 RepID=A0ABT3IQ58_9BACT|nr:nucleotidyltransferase [Chitinophaga nivalis]MCW3464241.1 nucleotidyltransferase [Chitinophaga nivalis]MCW3486068.1 nucleotidyltransferase [Chitinophaga nivalis]
MLTTEQRDQFSEIFDELGKSLDISKTDYDKAVTSYRYVGGWLAEKDSPLAPYSPVISPQGSFLLGTMIQPVTEGDHLDIDLVCKLVGKRSYWTQYDLKHAIGDRLKAHGTFNRMLRRKEGRRCWTLEYAEEANFHMDILPSIVGHGFQILLEKAANRKMEDMTPLAIRITDKELQNYKTATDPLEWLVSNMFGYAVWFEERCRLAIIKAVNFSESIKPVPTYQVRKTPLQRIVQILKRHRDIMFNGDEDKPISIIITTLAAHAYKKQTNILVGLQEVMAEMEQYIEDRYDPVTGQYYKWIGNPVNKQENFADKWLTFPQRKDNFYKWLQAVKRDIAYVTEQRSLPTIQETLNRSFGKKIITQTFSNLASMQRERREAGVLKMAASTGILGATGRTSLGNHTFFGSEE